MEDRRFTVFEFFYDSSFKDYEIVEPIVDLFDMFDFDMRGPIFEDRRRFPIDYRVFGNDVRRRYLIPVGNVSTERVERILQNELRRFREEIPFPNVPINVAPNYVR